MPFLRSNARMTLAITVLCAATLSGCSTTKKTTETAPAVQMRTTVPANLKGGTLAKGGTTAANRHVDPAAPKATNPAQAAAATTAVPPESVFPPAPAPANSIAGLATQPTGVRAETGTIFSQNAPMAADPSSTGPVPANLPRRNFNATTASVYSAQPAVTASACGPGVQGTALSC